MLLEQSLQSAMDAGAPVLLQMKREPFDRYHGQVTAMDQGHIALLHTGPSGGIRWTIPISEIAFCGIAIDHPSSNSGMISSSTPHDCGHHLPSSSNEDEPPASSVFPQ